jgi:hypothetical protein
MFPVRYELDLYILLRRNLVFNGLRQQINTKQIYFQFL